MVGAVGGWWGRWGDGGVQGGLGKSAHAARLEQQREEGMVRGKVRRPLADFKGLQ